MAFTQETDSRMLRRFLADASGLPGGSLERAYFPQTTSDVQAIVRECAAAKRSLTIAGNGSGVAGARIPFGGAVLAMERMDRLFEVGVDLRRNEGYAVVGPGLAVADFKAAIEAQGWSYLPDPTEGHSAIGGNLGTNASGPRSFLAGPTRRHVRALEVVLASGDVVELERGRYMAEPSGRLELPITSGKILALTLPLRRGPQTKNSAGYYLEPGLDAVDLFIGQEGTLGIITRAELRLVHPPASRFSGLVFFQHDQTLLRWVDEIRQRSRRHVSSPAGLQASSLEYLDARALRLLDMPVPQGTFGAVLFEQAVTTSQSSETLKEEWLVSLKEADVQPDQYSFADSPAELRQMEAWRHSIPYRINEMVRQRGLQKIGTDLAVPAAEFARMWSAYKDVQRDWTGDSVLFGHIGDCHLHLNLIPSDTSGLEKARERHMELATLAVKLGGTISAEHGVGKTKRSLLEMMVGPEGISALVKVKQQLDPEGILSPGNIFDYNT